LVALVVEDIREFLTVVVYGVTDLVEVVVEDIT
jgi:hypothetical protein